MFFAVLASYLSAHVSLFVPVKILHWNEVLTDLSKKGNIGDECLCLLHFWQLSTEKIQQLGNIQSMGRECNEHLMYFWSGKLSTFSNQTTHTPQAKHSVLLLARLTAEVCSETDVWPISDI